jgi:hypothetical protein
MTTELVERGDLDELVRHVDRLCAAREWDELVRLRDLCRKALERGKQLWPAAAHAEYRLALEAPAEWAAAMLVAGTGRFALGPLPEVAASTHTWAELAPHAPPGPVAALAAHERVVRGEDLSHVTLDPPVLELPLELQPWEPAYPLAVYESHKAEFPSPPLPPLAAVDLQKGAPSDDTEASRALLDLVAAWTVESNGRAEVAAVHGDATAAIAALGPPGARMAPLSSADALAHMAWAAASGGAHGRRRGMASGRFAAWWAVAALTGLLDDWPVHPDRLGEAANELRWFAWDAAEPVTGWSLRIAVEDPLDGLAWALSASDAA